MKILFKPIQLNNNFFPNIKMLTYEILKFTMKTIQVAINIIYRTKKANYQHNQKLIDKDIALYLNNI